MRIFSALAAFLAAMVVVWAGLPLLGPAYLLLAGTAVFEYAAMMRLRGIHVHRVPLLVATVLTLPAALPAGVPLAFPWSDVVPWRQVVLGLFAFALIATEVARPRRESFVDVTYTLFGYVWIPWLFSYCLTLRYVPDGTLGLATFALPLLAVVASDVGGWVFGTAFGRRKLAPVLSPDKSVEGAVGGLGLAVVVVVVAGRLLEGWLGLHIDVHDEVTFALLVASASQIGDLFESLVKRWAGVKDAGLFLPGQGGVLDRIDSSLFALPVAYFFLALVVLR